jgi:hypothetical protein
MRAGSHRQRNFSGGSSVNRMTGFVAMRSFRAVL